jgi:hypothetical protein
MMTRTLFFNHLMTCVVFLLMLTPHVCFGQESTDRSRQHEETHEETSVDRSDQASTRIRLLEKTLEELQEKQKQQRRRLEQLERNSQQQKIQLLKMEASSAAAAGGEIVRQADEEARLEEQTFRGGQRALQALNPEISVVGDALGKLIMNREGYASQQDRSGFVFRTVGIHFQSDLDPFSFTKIAVGVTPEGVGLGEAYMTWTSLLPGLSLTVGKFRQEFGVVNRWHLPGLDQAEFPLALREVLGPEGLNQVGLSLDWLMPRLWAHVNHLVLQVTNGQNEHLFAGRFFSIPSVLLRLKSYYDLSESTYLEIGLTGMLGHNNRRGVSNEQTGELRDETWRRTWAYGADWTLTWEPLQRAKYHNLVLRGELYGVRKAIENDHLQTIGLYQQIQGKLSRRWELGVRFDWTMPFTPDNAGQHTYGLQPYITWWQSPWVRARLLYAWSKSDLQVEDDHRALLRGEP